MSETVARQCGITYRQLDHWTRAGYLRPVPMGGAGRAEPVDEGGSGHWRDWPDEELHVARMMGLLTEAGVIPEVAHKVARNGHSGSVLSALKGAMS